MGAPTPPSQIGAQMNAQFDQLMTQRRADRMNRRSQANDELFATLLKSGQQPYRSIYDTQEDGMAAGGVKADLFQFPSLFDAGQSR